MLTMIIVAVVDIFDLEDDMEEEVVTEGGGGGGGGGKNWNR